MQSIHISYCTLMKVKLRFFRGYCISIAHNTIHKMNTTTFVKVGLHWF